MTASKTKGYRSAMVKVTPELLKACWDIFSDNLAKLKYKATPLNIDRGVLPTGLFGSGQMVSYGFVTKFFVADFEYQEHLCSMVIAIIANIDRNSGWGHSIGRNMTRLLIQPSVNIDNHYLMVNQVFTVTSEGTLSENLDKKTALYNSARFNRDFLPTESGLNAKTTKALGVMHRYFKKELHHE